jgi:transposase
MKTPIETQTRPLKEVPLDVLPEDVHSCHEVIRALEAQVEDYRGRLDGALRRLYGRRSERFNPDLPTLFDLGPGEAESEPVAEEPEPDPKPRARNGHGRRKLPKDLPRKRVEHDVKPEDKVCGQCGREKERIGEERSEQLEYVPSSIYVLEHVRAKYACKHCQEEVVTAAKPAQPIDKGLPGPGLLAHVVTSKYADHLPLHRQEGLFARHGVELTRSTLCDWAMASAELLEPIVLAMRREVLQSLVIHTDDTPVQVLTSAKPRATHRGYLWVYVGDAGHPYTLYDFTWTRERAGPKRFLEGFRGWLQADAYAGYGLLYATGRVIEVGCWAHARRKFFEAKDSSAVNAHLALSRIRALYQVEEQAKGREPAEVLRMRRERSLPILAEFRTWLDGLPQRVLPKSPIGQAAGYALGHWDALRRYTSDPCLDIDNNEAERALRHLVIGRKNWLFAGSARGGHAAAVLYSLIQSAKRHRIDPFAYLRDLLARVSTHPNSRISELFPDRWQKQIEELI